MTKILPRLPRPVFLTLLVSNIVYFVGLVFLAQAKVRSAGVLLVVILSLVGLSTLAHFWPPVQVQTWPTISPLPQTVQLTKPQLDHAIDVWQKIYQQQPKSEMVALTLLSLCSRSNQIECVNQTKQTLQDLNPALLLSKQ